MKNTRTIEAGEATELLFSFHNSFTPELMLLAKVASECNINPEFREVFSQDELELVALLLEHYRSLTIIFAKYRSCKDLTDEEMEHARQVMGKK